MRLREWTLSRNRSCAEFGTNRTAWPALSVINYRLNSRKRGSRNWSCLISIVDLADIACDRGDQAGDRAVGADGHVGVRRGLLPARAGLEPEDGGGDGLRTVPGRLPEQALGHLGVRFDL